MTKTIRIRKIPGRWTVRAAGAVIGETKSALELSEDGHAPVIYFPRENVAMAFLDATEKSTHCPYKGDATYFTLHTKNGPIENAAWSYDDPFEGVSEIKGHLAFYGHEKVTVEEV